MKKKTGIHKALDEIPFSQLENMQTRELLGRLERLHWCYEDIDGARDYEATELSGVKHKILFKTDPRWKLAYSDVKAILSEREHISRE